MDGLGRDSRHVSVLWFTIMVCASSRKRVWVRTIRAALVLLELLSWLQHPEPFMRIPESVPAADFLRFASAASGCFAVKSGAGGGLSQQRAFTEEYARCASTRLN